eukprot:1501496-Prymnesium_polylepis.1
MLPRTPPRVARAPDDASLPHNRRRLHAPLAPPLRLPPSSTPAPHAPSSPPPPLAIPSAGDTRRRLTPCSLPPTLLARSPGPCGMRRMRAVAAARRSCASGHVAARGTELPRGRGGWRRGGEAECHSEHGRQAAAAVRQLCDAPPCGERGAVRRRDEARALVGPQRKG